MLLNIDGLISDNFYQKITSFQRRRGRTKEKNELFGFQESTLL